MLSPTARNALNRLLAIHCRSFPQYLMYARPYLPQYSDEKMQAVAQIVEDQQQMAERIVIMLRDAEETPYLGKFPIELTDTHDLAIDFLLKEAVGYQKRDITAIEECVQALKNSPAAHALAEEALGMAKGHLHNLQEVAELDGVAAV